jgi:hypothetical protein
LFNRVAPTVKHQEAVDWGRDVDTSSVELSSASDVGDRGNLVALDTRSTNDPSQSSTNDKYQDDQAPNASAGVFSPETCGRSGSQGIDPLVNRFPGECRRGRLRVSTGRVACPRCFATPTHQEKFALRKQMKDLIDGYVKRVRELAEHVRGNEQATKQSLVGPLFTLLGYDLTDPRECAPEFRADFGKDRSAKPVDWAFVQTRRPLFFVEAKEASRKLVATQRG